MSGDIKYIKKDKIGSIDYKKEMSAVQGTIKDFELLVEK